MLLLERTLTAAVLRIYDQRGALILTQPLGGTQQELSLVACSAGVYVVQVHSAEGSFAERVVRP